MSNTKNCGMCVNWDGERFICNQTDSFSPANNYCPSFSPVPCCLSCGHWREDADHPGYGQCEENGKVMHSSTACDDGKFIPIEHGSTESSGTIKDKAVSFIKNNRNKLIIAALSALILAAVILLICKLAWTKSESPETPVPAAEPQSEQSDTVAPEEPVPAEEAEAGSVMYVSADAGLNLRASPDSNSKSVCLMKDGGSIELLGTKGEWSNVKYYSYEGWCISKYLSKTQDPFWAALPDALNAANKIVSSFSAKNAKGGHTTMDRESLKDFLKETSELTYATKYDFCSVLGKVTETRSNGVDAEYALIDSTKFKTVEDVCAYYFAYYSSETCRKLLKDKLCVIDGKLYASTEAETQRDEDDYIDEVKISGENVSYFNTTISTYDGSEKIRIEYFPCEPSDGIWVFSHAPLLHELVDWSGNGTYRNTITALKDLGDSHILPDGSALDDSMLGGSKAVSDNSFSIFDFDGDGKLELGIRWSTAEKAYQCESVFEYKGGSWHRELVTTLNVKYYDNGIALADDAENSTNGNTVWPYTIYSYHSETDVFTSSGSVACWDKSVAKRDENGRFFPILYDTDFSGTVYSITYEGYKKEGFKYSQKAYDKFVNELIGGAKKLSPEWRALTYENIIDFE